MKHSEKKVFVMITAEVIADAVSHLLKGQKAARLDYCSLAMDPLRLDEVVTNLPRSLALGRRAVSGSGAW
jgi:hypothetical protein